MQLHPELELTKVVVSEAGASVYSASAFASQELPQLDVRIRFGILGCELVRKTGMARSGENPALLLSKSGANAHI